MLTSKFSFIKHVMYTNYITNSYRLLSSSCGSLPADYDLIVVGGGIVGCGAAREILLRNPNLKIALVEKEHDLATHQSKYNSGVVHAGIYYKPGTLKAKLCGEGLNLLYNYCNKKKLPYKKVGKIIVATQPIEVERLKELEDRARKNNVPGLQVLNGQREIQHIEPHCIGLKALFSPETGIVNFQIVSLSFASDFQECGGDIRCDFEVIDFREGSKSEYPVMIVSEKGHALYTKYVLTCGGLYSDKLAVMSKCAKDPQIIPFRGEYLKLHSSKTYLVKGNIYPVPDPQFPFLGVHFTPTLSGDVILGPNAVLALAREGYTWGKVNTKELIETLTYPGFRKMALKYIGPGSYEMCKSVITALQVRNLQRFIPEITTKDVTKGLAGVRAQAMELNGDLCEDFVFSRGEGIIGKRILHCRNTPSPAGTSSLAIANMLADKVKKEFSLG